MLLLYNLGMGKHTLTSEELRQAITYDAETGVFVWKHRLSSAGRAVKRWGKQAGSVDHYGRIVVRLRGRLYFAHQLAWLYVHGKWPDNVIDHINGNNSDNRFCNLRDVPQVVNMQNRRTASINNPQNVLGVSWHKGAGRFRARVTVNSKEHHLGLFDTIEAAHHAYVEAKRRLHPGCTI